MRTQQDRDDDLNVGRLVEAYDEYIGLLASSEKMLLPMAVSHGFKFPTDAVDRGQQLRDRIANLKQALKL